MTLPGEQLIIKLWETLAEKGIGGLLKPWQLRRVGRAGIDVKREEALILAQAERDAADIRSGKASIATPAGVLRITSNASAAGASIDPTAEDVNASEVAQRVLLSEAVRKEVNVSRALLYAEKALENDPQEAPSGNPDDDWLYKWRDSASQVSNENLQDLWGRVLAGEVKSPGTYSLRTLEFLKSISHEEANNIATLSRFVVGNTIYRNAKTVLEANGVTFQFLLNMQELGIVSGVEAIGLTVTWGTSERGRFVRALKSNSLVLVSTAADPAKTIAMPVYQVTALGQQVLSLGTFDPHIEYLELVGRHFKSQGVDVSLARYVNVDQKMIRWFNSRAL